MSGEMILSKVAAPPNPVAGKVAVYIDSAAAPRMRMLDESGNIVIVNAPIQSSVAQLSGFEADKYLTGSAIVIPAGSWRAGGQYICRFDMTKTAACTSGIILSVRMGTLGTVVDPAIMTFTFGNGTAAIDTGEFEVLLTFRTVGAGVLAVIQGIARCSHHVAGAGLISTGAAGCGIIKATSAGFDSTSQTTLGLSFNGGTTGANFVGTCEMVQARFHNGQV